MPQFRGRGSEALSPFRSGSGSGSGNYIDNGNVNGNANGNYNESGIGNDPYLADPRSQDMRSRLLLCITHA